MPFSRCLIIILDSDTGYLCASCLGKITWKDGIIIEGSRLSCICNVPYVTDENFREIYLAPQEKLLFNNLDSGSRVKYSLSLGWIRFHNKIKSNTQIVNNLKV